MYPRLKVEENVLWILLNRLWLLRLQETLMRPAIDILFTHGAEGLAALVFWRRSTLFLMTTSQVDKHVAVSTNEYLLAPVALPVCLEAALTGKIPVAVDTLQPGLLLHGVIRLQQWTALILWAVAADAGPLAAMITQIVVSLVANLTVITAHK